MSPSIARKVIDFIYEQSPPDEKINIGFFGGEPLLEFELIKTITEIIETHRSYDSSRVMLSVVTNGTIFSDEIATFLIAHKIGLVISCDGPPDVQDEFRRDPDGRKTSDIVEANIQKALKVFSQVPVNSVFHPRTFRHLPQTISYLSSLGIRQIYLSPDFSATWQKRDADALPGVYEEIADQYINYYLQQDPHFISLIDSKITVILRGGYKPLERCRMGQGEFAFTPDGKIYPCERLIGNYKNGHCIGNIESGIKAEKMLCHKVPGAEINTECINCGINTYCMNWCGCSNYFSTGYYNRVSAFLCASEKAAIQASFNAFRILENKLGASFVEHLGGVPLINSINQ